MNSGINWPNIITLTRIALALVTFWLLINYSSQEYYLKLCFICTIIVIAGDYLDGQVARSLKQATPFGAWLDIAGDRLVEICYWIVFSYLHWISPWIAIIFVARGILVDGIRSFAMNQGYSAFGEKTMMNSMLGKFLVSSRFSRVGYAVCKAVAFGLVILSHKYFLLEFAAMAFVYGATAFCIIRGLPVLIEGKRFLQNGQN
jgi:CDP-diacylglycerol---glycerol-3-phosphate 3-phosphatidyltransferase